MPERPHRDPVRIDAGPVSILDVEHVARHHREVRLEPGAREALERSAGTLGELIAGGEPIYGVNTGFGSLSRQRIETDQLSAVQHNLLRSHAAGVGPALTREVVRGMLLLLVGSLSRGRSGIRPVVVERLIEFLNADAIPVVPSVGSVGASGDLAPLAHACLPLIGEGWLSIADGPPRPAAAALEDLGLEPITLGPKEGIALINGTHLMAARGALAIADAERVADAAICAAAMSIDGVRATNSFLDERVMDLRAHPGPKRVASRIRALLAGSEILASHVENDPRVQDPYSFRCIPQVLGAAIDAIDYVRHRVENELAAVTDNPLVFQPSDDDSLNPVVSAGNFHGLPIALPLDVLTIALTHIAGIAERRVYYTLAATDPESHLRPHLSPHPGVESGFMISQYTAAACCNELINLSTPATVANIPTSAGMEDYNSFGPRAAAKAARAVDLARTVVAIELLCAAEAIECQRPLKSGPGVERLHDAVREAVPPLEADRSPAPDIEALDALISVGRFR